LIRLKVIGYYPDRGLVCFARREVFCIDSDCGAESITLYYKKVSSLSKSERKLLEEYRRKIEGVGYGS